MPIDLNGTIYKLCLLDTNAISEMVKHPSREFRNFINRMLPRKVLPCFSVLVSWSYGNVKTFTRVFLNYFRYIPASYLKATTK